ncbi:MAG TPA: hypothetical protein VK841_11610, partial [Polyangiaceae bacterium]|nr:hypothetical protein [Polyangiaceae bacterium]
MELVQRYEAFETVVPSHADADSTQRVLRAKLAAVGLDVPSGASPGFVDGMIRAAIFAGRLGPTSGETRRADAAADIKNEVEQARDRMVQRARDAWRRPRADRDASREPRIQRPTTPAPSGPKRLPSAEYAAPDTFAGNLGNASGGFFGDEDGWESAGN